MCVVRMYWMARSFVLVLGFVPLQVSGRPEPGWAPFSDRQRGPTFNQSKGLYFHSPSGKTTPSCPVRVMCFVDHPIFSCGSHACCRVCRVGPRIPTSAAPPPPRPPARAPPPPSVHPPPPPPSHRRLVASPWAWTCVSRARTPAPPSLARPQPLQRPAPPRPTPTTPAPTPRPPCHRWRGHRSPHISHHYHPPRPQPRGSHADKTSGQPNHR